MEKKTELDISRPGLLPKQAKQQNIQTETPRHQMRRFSWSFQPSQTKPNQPGPRYKVEEIE
jgi:hypothetical protein